MKGVKGTVAYSPLLLFCFFFFALVNIKFYPWQECFVKFLSWTAVLFSAFSVWWCPFAVYEKSSTSTHLEELEDPEKYAEEGVKVITRQEYVSRLHELKDEINRAWCANDRVTSLKLSIKVTFIWWGGLFLICDCFDASFDCWEFVGKKRSNIFVVNSILKKKILASYFFTMQQLVKLLN